MHASSLLAQRLSSLCSAFRGVWALQRSMHLFGTCVCGDLSNSCMQIPLSRLLLETDSPDGLPQVCCASRQCSCQ